MNEIPWPLGISNLLGLTVKINQSTIGDTFWGGAHGVVVIVVGNEHGDSSSIPGRDWLHFT